MKKVEYKEQFEEINKLSSDVRGRYMSISVRNLYKFYKQGSLELQPFFQRNYVVQNKTKFQTELFRSIFQNWTINTIHMQELKDDDKIYRMIDGQQRMKTIFNFLDGKTGISIKSLSRTLKVSEAIIREMFIKEEYLNSPRRRTIKKITIKNIKQYWLDKILDYSVDAFIYSPDLSLREIVELFKRMNSNTTKLNDMEIRKAIIYNKEYYSHINKLARELFNLRNYYRKKIGMKELKKFEDKRYNMMETLILFDGLLFGLIDENASKISDTTTTPITDIKNWNSRASLLDLIAENRKKIYENNPELKEEHMKKLEEAIKNFTTNIKQLYPNQYVLTASYYSGGRLTDRGFNTNIFVYFALFLSRVKPKLLQKIATSNGRFPLIREKLLETIKNPELQKIISVSTSNRRSIEKIYNTSNSIAKELLPEVFSEDKVNIKTYKRKIWNEYISKGKYPICHICGEEIRSFEEFELDHAVPDSLGGANSKLNLRPAHKHCNRIKQDDVILAPIPTQGVGE